MTRGRRILLSLLATLAVAAAAPAQEFRETDLKAVFLLRFGSFMQWPVPTAGNSDAAFTIGVLGDDPVAAVLEQAVQGETVAGRPVRVERYRNVGQVSGCEILFISRTKREHLPRILDVMRGRPVLTVSDIEDFTERGGMVGLTSDERRIRLRINVGAARQAGISISSKLLRVVEVVGETSSGA